MTAARSAGPWIALLAIAGLATLYAGPIQSRFLNDDYLFLETARLPLAQSIGALGPLGNYYRPVSRQIAFEALTALGSDRPLVFHLFSFLVFLVALALLLDLARAFLPWAGAAAATLYYATLPFQRVNLTWTSCLQDLLALAFTLAAFAFFRRGRDGPAVLAYLLAVFSKEAALPLPVALFAWERWMAAPGPIARRPGAARLAPFGMVAVAWAALTLWVRSRHPAASSTLHFDLAHFTAGYAHGLQSLLGLDHPAGFLDALAGRGPQVPPLLLLAPLAWWVARDDAPPPRPARAALRFGLLWFVAFTLVTGPVASSWSSYYYTLAAVGGALLVGAALSRIGAAGWLALVGGLLWWHAGATSVRAFAVAERPWIWTSHLTPFYFERAAALSSALGRQLQELEPKPAPDTRFFFATLPPWAGFQMGNGAALRLMYRDPTLQSHFYSQFSETTAAMAPCRFYYWDGSRLAPLYPDNADVFFQVGSDLMVLERLPAARHAFRRGLLAGGDRGDLLYWLGWTELWLGRRGMAEAAWTAVGARDDSVAWDRHMRLAREALLEDGDTLRARRELAAAIRNAIGRPEAHSILGSLLLTSRPKYGMLELGVALRLNPGDWVARRDLIVGLAAQRLDEPAWRELARLAQTRPEWRSDTVLLATARALERRSAGGTGIVEFRTSGQRGQEGR